MNQKKYFEVIVAENFPKLMTGTKLQFQEVQRPQSRKYKHTHTNDRGHKIFKLLKTKDKEEILKEIRGQQKETSHLGEQG